MRSPRGARAADPLVRRGGHARRGVAHPAHPLDPVRREGRGRRAGAPHGSVDARADRGHRGRPRRAGGRHRPLPLPGLGGDLDDVVGVVPREGRVTGAVPRAGHHAGRARSWSTPFVVPETRDLVVAARDLLRERAPTSPSSSTSTAAPPASSRSRTCSRRSSARSTTSTTGPRPTLTRVQRPGEWRARRRRCTPTRCSTPAASRCPRATTRRWPASCSTRLGPHPRGRRRLRARRLGARGRADGPAAGRHGAARRTAAELAGRGRVVSVGTARSSRSLLLLANGFFVAVEFALVA